MKLINKKVYLPNRQGVTFIELIIYIAIMGILMAAITSFIASNKKIGDRNEAINEVEFQGSEILEIISQTIRNSISINEPTLGNNSSQLSLETDTDNPTVFDLSSGEIRIKRGSNSATNLNSDRIEISNLNFENFGNDSTKGSIQFSFDVSYSNLNMDYQRNFSASASLR